MHRQPAYMLSCLLTGYHQLLLQAVQWPPPAYAVPWHTLQASAWQVQHLLRKGKTGPRVLGLEWLLVQQLPLQETLMGLLPLVAELVPVLPLQLLLQIQMRVEHEPMWLKHDAGNDDVSL